MVFYPDTRDIVLVGAARVDYRDMRLLADTVRLDASSEVVWATGEPELFDAGESVRGARMVYDMASRQGRVDQAASRYEFGFYSGDEITRITPREFNIVNARFTTCDQDSAHFYFFSPSMKVFPGDKAVARPLYMYVYDTPVLYLPFWVFPIRTGRQSGFTIPKLGQTSRDGRYLRDMGYYWAPSDYLDFLLQGDIMEKTRFVLRARERHRLRYVHEGFVRGEWRREFESSRDRWLLFAEHMHELPEEVIVRVKGEFVSDNSYLSETQQTPEDRMVRELRSWASLSRSWSRASLQVVLDRTSYLDTDPDTIPNEVTSVQELPDVRLTVPSSPLLPTPSDPSERSFLHTIYWNLSSHYVATDTRREDSRNTYSGLRNTADLTSSTRLGGWLSISPRISGICMVYDRDRSGNSLPYALQGGASISVGTDIFGVFPASFLDITAIRHTLSPSVSFSFSPDNYLEGSGDGLEVVPADSAATRLFSFSDFSLPASRRLLTFSLYNSLEIKRATPSGLVRSEVASLDLSTSLDLEDDSTPWTPLRASLAMSPTDAFQMRLDGSWDLYEGSMGDITVTSSLRLAGSDPTLVPDSLREVSAQLLPFRLTLAHNYRYSQEGGSDLSKLRISSSLELTPSWHIDYNAYYDILEGSFINHSYSLRRDLHCWEAVFVRHVSDVDTGFYFRINIKEIPDIKLEQHVSNF
ncbi:LPS-assembly protein LptD [Candidatus Fermentibacterales bacterium]|nr:LPS-assembly protein LptD [Candidatus Fermentibacterales bacterium]